jgi:hypothetical protein
MKITVPVESPGFSHVESARYGDLICEWLTINQFGRPEADCCMLADRPSVKRQPEQDVSAGFSAMRRFGHAGCMTGSRPM